MTNLQTFNKNIAAAEKLMIFNTHKSYEKLLATIRKKQ